MISRTQLCETIDSTQSLNQQQLHLQLQPQLTEAKSLLSSEINVTDQAIVTRARAEDARASAATLNGSVVNNHYCWQQQRSRESCSDCDANRRIGPDRGQPSTEGVIWACSDWIFPVPRPCCCSGRECAPVLPWTGDLYCGSQSTTRRRLCNTSTSSVSSSARRNQFGGRPPHPYAHKPKPRPPGQQRGPGSARNKPKECVAALPEKQ